MFRIAVLASGRGTNLQALLDAQARGDLGDASIQLVLSDIPDANALTRAQDAGVEARFIDPEGLSREAYDRELVAAIGDEIDLVVLAGFMRILSPTFLSSFPRRIVNIHPSLLPSFPGLHAQRQALEAGARIAGATTHFVDEEV
ncbi:MAG: phosphoribosylglycinamide formyltransferase, partial [Candidatus Thermoplasmatota archaeon]|nr:phosphoribosylglycinamide formyltransferase [Candidatus Thermoplasmatota archaeon]